MCAIWHEVRHPSWFRLVQYAQVSFPSAASNCERANDNVACARLPWPRLHVPNQLSLPRPRRRLNFGTAQHMAQLRASHPENNPKYTEVLKRLKKNADKAVKHGPYSVMDKKEVGPSGDKHDYVSFARYWWPNPDTANGLPYVRRDGRTNQKALEQGDHVTMGNMFDDVETLALASYYFDDPSYGRHAAELARVWFLDPATRMNPNIKYGQAIPGRNDGRGSGIIDTRHFMRMIDSVALLRQSGTWTDEDDTALKAWMTQYLDWLLMSDAGQHEHAENNNHGTWYDAQTAALPCTLASRDLARDIARTRQVVSRCPLYRAGWNATCRARANSARCTTACSIWRL